MEMLADPHHMHIRIAIGQGHHRPALREKLQRRQGVVKQLDPLASGKELVKGRFGQGRIVAHGQRQPDGLAAQAAEVGFQIRAQCHDFMAQGAHLVRIAQVLGRTGSMLREPLQQNASALAIVGQMGQSVSSRSRLMARIWPLWRRR
jgi:hypothetical protein